MCDYMIMGSYYLCDDCLDEFKACMRTWPATLMNFPATTPELLVDHFMTTAPRTFSGLQAVLADFDAKTSFLIARRST